MTIPTPAGQGDISDPNTWESVLSGTLPPTEYKGVGGVGTGQYNWQGNAAGVTGGQIAFVGNPAFLKGTAALTWSITQRATDGSQPQLAYTVDGSTYTTLNLGLEGQPQQTINQSGLISVSLGAATKFAFGIISTGGSVVAGATQWIVAVAITRNVNETVTWDAANPYNPLDFNASRLDFNGQPSDTLANLRKRIIIRLGFSNQSTTPPPGMAALINDFLYGGQAYLWRTFTALQTRRFFRWKIVPGQRFYSLMDNDDDLLSTFHIDPLKSIEWVGIQDTRNVWYPMIEGIPPQLYTMITKPWRPARYIINQALEIYPAPDQTYYLWMRGNFGLLSFSSDSDTTTIDSHLVFLHALANAKNHYGQPDAKDIEAQAQAYRAFLVAASHATASYIPGSIAIPPAIRPTLIQFTG